jgi:hypothetical protein
VEGEEIFCDGKKMQWRDFIAMARERQTDFIILVIHRVRMDRPAIDFGDRGM